MNDVDPQAWLADVLARIADSVELGAIESDRSRGGRNNGGNQSRLHNRSRRLQETIDELRRQGHAPAPSSKSKSS